ncbi:polysaccharide pyruvyl transferase family protein [Methanogenium sp. MK-MG]|uniref:polysaccharide pyruvyl transferase family protein n=1 Tax=Methanogenium sp. MK-MG TaxID=2599926 RepID=UPI0013EC2962|nr:polysaccharide pyruvyl transferase family protein [Methanogenium sp. MK-MG]KAF1079004.1 hypothetical protein MKMG_00012 [Methanogenium sp. MK-MG]
MNDERPLFILAGNGPYTNRGCEAIVRGTTKILREHFVNPRFLCVSFFQNDAQFEEQRHNEYDASITHVNCLKLNKKEAVSHFWKPENISYVYKHLFNRDKIKYITYQKMLPYLKDASAVLSVGGDNYSLDYGVPTNITDLDDIVVENGKPMFIWGASVGPFSAMPDYEQYMSNHLKDVTGIFARESATVEYLRSIGVRENVSPVADPAFLMDAVKPSGIEDDLPIDDDSLGINLSPLMAKYVTGGDQEAWKGIAAKIVEKIAKKTEMPIYLIPHVTNRGSNDYEFMSTLLSLVGDKTGNISLVSPHYNAEETKYIIGQMSLFAGARTHSTIAALSSCVPTLSFAYSIKAKGINRDIFGHEDYVLSPLNLNADTAAHMILSMVENQHQIRKELEQAIPSVQESAMKAGQNLRKIIQENSDA